jgi:hypothetical protein
MCLETFCRERVTHGQSLLHIISMWMSRTVPCDAARASGLWSIPERFSAKFGILTKYANNPDLHRPDDPCIVRVN